ncbi:N-acetylglucosamine-6-phosphate deacetylase [Lacunimicrobium album]
MPKAKYIDLQINGYQGIDFNQSELTAESLHVACVALRRDRVESILATIITDDVSVMSSRLARIVELRQKDGLIESVIAGFHIEGPFISSVPGYIGAHPVQHAQAARWSAMEPLLDAAGGLTKMVTIAPEQDPGGAVTKRLADLGVLVAAGHTNASLDQLDACIDSGLSLFTHLGNGCPRLMDRHDNIIQRALSRAEFLHFGFIADGAHVPFFALANYLKLVGIDRAFVVSDAIAAAGCGPGRYQLGGREVTVGKDGVPRAEDDSHLVGSATPMFQMAANLRDNLGLSGQEIEQLTCLNPRQLLAAAVRKSGEESSSEDSVLARSNPG